MLIRRRPLVCSIARFFWPGSWAAGEQHGFAIRQGIQELTEALDERLLLVFVAPGLDPGLRGMTSGL
jgi:hypothetical protein